MELLQLAAQVFKSSVSDQEEAKNLEENTIIDAMGNLLGGADGKIDLGDILNIMNGLGMTSIVSSWLGSGSNENISASQIMAALGSDKVSGFAQQLGLSEGTAMNGLMQAIPELMDKSSPNGEVAPDLSAVTGLLGSFLR